jgi:hypothetical protein
MRTAPAWHTPTPTRDVQPHVDGASLRELLIRRGVLRPSPDGTAAPTPIVRLDAPTLPIAGARAFAWPSIPSNPPPDDPSNPTNKET